MKKLVQIILLVLIPKIMLGVLIYSFQNRGPESSLDDLIQKYEGREKTIIDHSRFEELQQDFDSPRELTATCLSCHFERGEELLTSHHFLWERPEYAPSRGVVYLGKRNAINNWCTSVLSSEQTCNRCHAGFGWDVGTFDYDYSDATNVDCLVCHDNSFTYHKVRGDCDAPDFRMEIPDINVVLRNLSSPQKANCGACHFWGGGYNNVKHGDLEMALLTADRDMDVHMARDGADLSCIDCHKTENHNIRGRYFGGIAMSNTNRVHCQDCHGHYPHTDNLINEHCVKVSCQTCHIPVYAKANATVLYWDWRTAGKLKDGKSFVEYDDDGNMIYQTIKGTYEWGSNLSPDYVWFNGTANQHLMTDTIGQIPLQMNTLYGRYKDRDAKIIPVKINRGFQPYDIVNNTLAHMKLYDCAEGKGAFWVDYDLDRAIEEGMAYIDMPYSGEYDFVETVNHMLVNHMVSPKEKALTCTDCHSRTNSRLAGLTDFYMPGRDYNATLNGLGKALILLTLLGVFAHAGLRIYFAVKSSNH